MALFLKLYFLTLLQASFLGFPLALPSFHSPPFPHPSFITRIAMTKLILQSHSIWLCLEILV